MTVKGDVQITEIKGRTVAIQVYICEGNPDAAKRCRDRDYEVLLKEHEEAIANKADRIPYQGLDKHCIHTTTDGEAVYSLSWLVD